MSVLESSVALQRTIVEATTDADIPKPTYSYVKGTPNPHRLIYTSLSRDEMGTVVRLGTAYGYHVSTATNTVTLAWQAML